ncbi:hypothetical protein OH77DRAFT_1207340 [Trametes cingulata]|nr:hypothetical protein OH77DRAFT_1207340 [Trametes cingulata]
MHACSKTPMLSMPIRTVRLERAFLLARSAQRESSTALGWPPWSQLDEQKRDILTMVFACSMPKRLSARRKCAIHIFSRQGVPHCTPSMVLTLKCSREALTGERLETEEAGKCGGKAHKCSLVCGLASEVVERRRNTARRALCSVLRPCSRQDALLTVAERACIGACHRMTAARAKKAPEAHPGESSNAASLTIPSGGRADMKKHRMWPPCRPSCMPRGGVNAEVPVGGRRTHRRNAECAKRRPYGKTRPEVYTERASIVSSQLWSISDNPKTGTYH